MSSVMRRVSVRNLVAHKVRLLLTSPRWCSAPRSSPARSSSPTPSSTASPQSSATRYQGIDDPACSPSTTSTPACRSRSPTAIARRRRRARGGAAGRRRRSCWSTRTASRIKTGGAPSVGGAWIDAATARSATPSDVRRRPRTTAAPDEIVVNDGAATSANLRIGDHIKVRAQQRTGGRRDDHRHLRHHVRHRRLHRRAVRPRPGDEAVHRRPALQRASTWPATAASPSRRSPTAIAQAAAGGLTAKTGNQVRDDGHQRGVASALSFINYILLAFGFDRSARRHVHHLQHLLDDRGAAAARTGPAARDRREPDARCAARCCSRPAVVGVVGSAARRRAAASGSRTGCARCSTRSTSGCRPGALVLSARTVIVALMRRHRRHRCSARYSPARRASVDPSRSPRCGRSSPRRPRPPPAAAHDRRRGRRRLSGPARPSPAAMPPRPARRGTHRARAGRLVVRRRRCCSRRCCPGLVDRARSAASSAARSAGRHGWPAPTRCATRAAPRRPRSR